MAGAPETAVGEIPGLRSARSRLRPLSRLADILVALVIANLRVRFGRGHLRVAKWLLDPFALVGVYMVFVVLLLDRPGPAPGLSLACAIVPFQVIFMSVNSALTAVREHRATVLNTALPRELLPIAAVLTDAFGFAASFGLLAVMMGVYGVAPTLALLWLPLVLALTVAFAIAAAYVALLLGIWLPQLSEFVRSFMRATYFLAPGLIALEVIPGTANELVRINPLTGIFEAYRDLFLYGTSPAAWEFAIPLAWTAALLAIFMPIFRREAPHIAKVA